MTCPQCHNTAGHNTTGNNTASDRTLDHCHGTLILHSIVQVECTDDECTDLSIARHALVADCTAIVGGCACVVVIEDAAVLRAS